MADDRPDAVDRAVWLVHGWVGSNTGCLGGCIAHLLARPDPTTLNKSGWLGAVSEVVRSGSSGATHTSLQICFFVCHSVSSPLYSMRYEFCTQLNWVCINSRGIWAGLLQRSGTRLYRVPDGGDCTTSNGLPIQ